MLRRVLSFEDRAQIAVGVRQGLTDREIAELVGRHRTIIWRERRRNSVKSGLHKPVTAHCRAARSRRRPQASLVDCDPVLAARVRADLARSRTPRQIAGRLRLEANDVDGGMHGALSGRSRQDNLA